MKLKMLELVPKDIKFIVGAEISSTYRNQEYHITAYNCNPDNNKLKETCQYNIKQKEDYNRIIVEDVKKIVKLEDISDYYSYQYDKKRGGWTSLNYLIDKKVVGNMKEYFEIISASDKKLVFKEPLEAIRSIKESGGYPFLAHPAAYLKGEKLPKDILDEWKDFGICGIECYSPYLNNIEDAEYYVNYCRENNLMISAGSDCHGSFSDRQIGIPRVRLSEIRLDFI
ncbi:MAG: hypothetical protein GX219_00525 [Tissierellia bacterium]|nr:hypothetical protein [Tissierellia bacterium]